MAGALALLAGGAPSRSAQLAIAMLALQFSIGAANDLVDEGSDRLSRPEKPLPAGRVSPGVARAIAMGGALGSLGIAAAVSPATAFVAALMLGCGQLYNLALKGTILSWLPYSMALPLVPLYSWIGATGGLPPRAEIIVPVAVLAGFALALGNALIDLEGDRAAGVYTVAVRLGGSATRLLLVVSQVGVYGLAGLALLGPALPDIASAALLAGSLATSAAGLLLSLRSAFASRRAGWAFQVIGIALLAIGWLTHVA